MRMTRVWILQVLLIVFCVLLTAVDVPAAPEPAVDANGQLHRDPEIIPEDLARDDAEIRSRLRAIFGQLDELKGVNIEVMAGVVNLSGGVNSMEAEERALALAEKAKGVVAVENALQVNRDVEPRLRTTSKEILSLLSKGIAALPLFLLALVVLAAFWFAGRWLARHDKLLRRISPNPFIAELVAQLLRALFVITGIVLALVLLDATALLGTILGAAGIIGLAVGFAVRDTVENYIASILLSLRNPFEVNDYVDIEGHQGNVLKLTSRATILISPDGNHIRIPNATVFKAVIINYTRHPERRFEFDIGIDTEQDLTNARALALQTLGKVPGILSTPQSMVTVEALGDSNVVLRCYAWLDQGRFDLLKVRSEAITSVKQVFDDAGIVMPEPIFKVRLYKADSTPNEPVDAPSTTTERVPNDIEKARVDVSVDRTMERRVTEECQAAGDDNLLSPSAPHEI